LFAGRRRGFYVDRKIIILGRYPAETAGGYEVGGDYTHRLAGIAAFTRWAVNQVLAAAEAVLAQQMMQTRCTSPRQVRKQFPFLPPWQIGAGHCSGQE
jgi:hypothetical protein